MRIISITFLILLVFISCKNEQNTQDFVSISGKASNAKSDTIAIANPKYSKYIKLDDEGNFKDTLNIEEGFYMLQNGDQNIVVKLKNGYNINLEYDAKNLVNTIAFSGLGAGTNNYFADKMRLQENGGFLNFNEYFILDKPEFDKKVTELKNKLDNIIINAQDLDSTVISNDKKSNQQLLNFLNSNYASKHEMLITLGKGKPSPEFNYPDINGKRVALADLKGKYVYIDVWATWCGPCKREIPYLKEIEAKYEGKNIAFVGLSIDKQENKDKWKAMVEQRGIKGYQVLADNDWRSKFIEDYRITGIPRFILIDPQGNIVSADAPRPSQPELLELFNELKI